jgi:2,3-bisphosphoglycerate-dependent phosphoglycerate mutase
MNIYFVRHGESELNAQRIHQDSKAGLSNIGIKQANQIAELFSTIPIDKMISSPFERARQTANTISKKINLPIEFNDLFVELKRPTEIELKHVDQPEVTNIKNIIWDNWNNPNFRHSDEETFFDFKNRANKALKFIQKLHVNQILIVTHGEFIRMLICLMVLGNELDADTFKKFRKYLMTSNTGITVCKYDKEQWKLITWNDINHFPE